MNLLLKIFSNEYQNAIQEVAREQSIPFSVIDFTYHYHQKLEDEYRASRFGLGQKIRPLIRMIPVVVYSAFLASKAVSITEETAVKILWEAFPRVYSKPVRKLSLLLFNLLEKFNQPISILSTWYARLNHITFDQALKIDYETDQRSFFYANVTRCYFHQFFLAHRVPQLAPIICAWDRNWFEAIDPKRHSIRFQRDQMLSLGHDYCAFHFHRQENLSE